MRNRAPPGSPRNILIRISHLSLTSLFFFTRCLWRSRFFLPAANCLSPAGACLRPAVLCMMPACLLLTAQGLTLDAWRLTLRWCIVFRISSLSCLSLSLSLSREREKNKQINQQRETNKQTTPLKNPQNQIQNKFYACIRILLQLDWCLPQKNLTPIQHNNSSSSSSNDASILTYFTFHC